MWVHQSANIFSKKKTISVYESSVPAFDSRLLLLSGIRAPFEVRNDVRAVRERHLLVARAPDVRGLGAHAARALQPDGHLLRGAEQLHAYRLAYATVRANESTMSTRTVTRA